MKTHATFLVVLSLLLAACAGSGRSSMAANTYGLSFADIMAEGVFQVPNSNLILFINLPKLIKKEEQGDINNGYSWEGQGSKFNVTFFIEPPKSNGKTNKAVYEHYWPLASRYPIIDQSTVKMSETARYVKVEYFYRGTLKGKQINMKNINYYAFVQDRWLDVHVSVSNPTAADNAILASLDKTIEFKVLDVK